MDAVRISQNDARLNNLMNRNQALFHWFSRLQRELTDLQEQIDSLNAENEILRNEIIRLGQVRRILGIPCSIL